VIRSRAAECNSALTKDICDDVHGFRNNAVSVAAVSQTFQKGPQWYRS
jgi:hypothetical protein